MFRRHETLYGNALLYAVVQFVDFSHVTPLDAYMDQSFVPDVGHNGSSLATPSQSFTMVSQW